MKAAKQLTRKVTSSILLKIRAIIVKPLAIHDVFDVIIEGYRFNRIAYISDISRKK